MQTEAELLRTLALFHLDAQMRGWRETLFVAQDGPLLHADNGAARKVQIGAVDRADGQAHIVAKRSRNRKGVPQDFLHKRGSPRTGDS